MLVSLIAAAGFVTVAVNNSWWVDPHPTAAPDQTAPNGSSVFTRAGVDYFGRTGLVVVRMDTEALGAAELGLDADGSREFSSDRPLTVQVVGSNGALAVDRVSTLTMNTKDGELVSVEVLQAAAEGFVGAQTTLTELAELYGWSADDVETLPERFGEARRAHPDSPTSVTVGPGTQVGLAVTAVVTVDGGAYLTYRAERLP